jgi:hypothetical protein
MAAGEAKLITVENLIRTAAKVVDIDVQERYLASALPSLDGEQLAYLLQSLVRLISSPSHRIIYQSFLRVIIGGPKLNEMVRQECYAHCALNGLVAVVRVLLPVPAQRSVITGGVEGSPKLLEMPLGTKKWKAKTLNRDILFQISLDPNPSVIRIWLDNPRVTEADVVLLGSRRPHVADCIREVMLSRRWIIKRRVLETLTQNPYCTSHLAAGHLPLLEGPKLKQVASNPTLHPMLRETAAQLLDLRETWPLD